MATAIRSKLSARAAKATLYVVQAEDEIVNPWSELHNEQIRKIVGEQLLRHPNMNTTGRLPSFAMFHIGMRVRLTQPVEPPDAVVDATGTVVGIEFHPLEPQSHKRGAGLGHGAAEPVASVVLLRHQPLCVYVKLDDCDTEFLPPKPCAEHVLTGVDRTCSACSYFPGVLAVKPCSNKRPWQIEVSVPSENKVRETKVIRKTLPIVCLKASTLHVLQGATADPGLIFHWVFPRLLKRPMRWLAVYVALSRVRRLKNLRSIGLTRAIREIIEEGPPDSLPTQFHKLFNEKEVQTSIDADVAMKALGWPK